MTDWAQSGRIDRYYAKLVDPHTMVEFPEEIELDGPNCSVTWAADSDTFVSASVTLVNQSTYRNVGSIPVNCMVRLYHGIRVDDHDSLEHPYIVGTFFNTTAGTTSKFGTVYRKLNCYSTMLRHTEDVLLNDYSFLGAAAGTANNHCIGFIQQIIESDGGRLAIDTSCWETDPASGRKPIEWTFGQDTVFERGRNKADVLNEVAGRIACEMNVVSDGSMLIRRRIPANEKPCKYVFESGVNCVYLPGIEWTDTRPSVRNRVLATRTSKDSTESAVAVLADTSVSSFAMLGRYSTETVSTSDEYEDLSALARQKLSEVSESAVFIEIESVSIPSVEIGDVVRYINDYDWIQGEGIDCLCEVVEKASTFDIGCMTKWKLKVIG